MNIAILEISPTGHYTYVESMVKVFSTDKENKIIIYTNDVGKKAMYYLENQQVSIKVKQNTEGYDTFLSSIKKSDVLYVVTLEAYAKEPFNIMKVFLKTNFDCPIHYVIHNIDFWFEQNLLSKIKNIFYHLTSFKNLTYRLKIYFYYTLLNPKIIEKVINSNGRFVNMSEAVGNELAKYVGKKNVEIIPFSVFDDKIEDKTQNNQKLRVCIPGNLSLFRRNYQSIFNLFEKDVDGLIKENIEWDFLGSISVAEGGNNVYNESKNWIDKGYLLHIYDEWLSFEDYDNNLFKSDIILANLHLVQGSKAKYGKTKETGITFSMIKAAKPGLFPSEYPLDNSLTSSVLTFKNYDEVAKILIHLSQNREALNTLKAKALENSKKYTPLSIYNRLEKNN
jgi:hypothetical protein